MDKLELRADIIELLKKNAYDSKLCIYDYILTDNAEDEISNKVIVSLKALIARIDLTREKIKNDDEMFAKTLEDFINDIGYYDYLKDMDDGDDRLENVRSLFDDIRHYLKNNPESTFDEYLQNVALVSAQDDIKDGEYVKLMTVHTAKGLEFPIVFIVRFDEGVFPNARALNESGFKALEEERRLAYVALTRAKERLYLTYSNGYSYVNQENLSESRFIKESGNHIEHQVYSFSPKPQKARTYHFDDTVGDDKVEFNDYPVRQDFSQETNDVTSWAVGDICIHQNYGKGVVLKVEDDTIIVVNFEEHGQKTIMGNHPKVSKGNK